MPFMHDSKIHVIATRIQEKSRILGKTVHYLAEVIRWIECVPAYLVIVVWFSYFLMLELPFRKIFLKRPAVKQKILFLTNEGFLYAPARVRCYEFSKNLGELGYETQVFTLFDHIFKFKGFPKRYLFQIEFVIAAIRAFYQLSGNSYSVIISQRPSYDLLCAFALRLLDKTKILFDVDDWTFPTVYLRGIRARTIFKLFGKYSEGVIVSSNRLEEEFSNYPFSKIYKIPTYVDHTRFEKRTSYHANEVLFGWNGTLFEEFVVENVRVLIRAFQKACQGIERTNIKMRLEVLCGGAYHPHLKKEVEEKYGHLPITIRGWIDPKEMPSYLRSIDVGLYSLAMSPNIRPEELDNVLNFQLSKSPTKLFEYMACGVTTISTFMGEAVHFIENGQTGLVGKTEDEVAQHFITLASNENLREQMGTKAYQTCISNYTQKIAAQKLEHIIKSIGSV